jgi:hypothetical protein
MNPILILKLTALTYLGLLAAGLLMPGIVGLRQHLGALPRFIRQLFWVYSLVHRSESAVLRPRHILPRGSARFGYTSGPGGLWIPRRLLDRSFRRRDIRFRSAALPDQPLAKDWLSRNECGVRTPASNLRLGGVEGRQSVKLQLPILEGVITRRLSLNFHLRPTAIQSLLPAPFRPRLVLANLRRRKEAK